MTIPLFEVLSKYNMKQQTQEISDSELTIFVALNML